MPDAIALDLIVDDKGTVSVRQFSRKTERTVRGTSRVVDRSMTKAFTNWAKKALPLVDKMKKRLLGIKGTLLAMAGGYGIIKLAKSFLEASKTTEDFQVRLGVLLGSVEEGNRLFKDMADYASKVPFEFEKVMGAATQLAGIMKGGRAEIKKWMPLIGDIAAATGFTIQKATEQIIRMYSAGAASADLFRERGILSMLGFEVGVSYTAKETRKRLVEMWEVAGSKFKGVTAKLAKTWAGMMSMISDKWFQFRNLVMEAGIFDELKKNLDDINKRFGIWIKTNKEIIKQKVPEYIDKVKNALQKIWNIISYDPAIIQWGLIGLAIGGRKFAVVAAGIAHMTTWAENLVKAFQNAAKGIVTFSEIAKANFKELEALAQRGGPFFRGKIPPRPKAAEIIKAAPPPLTPWQDPFGEMGLKERLAMLTGHHDAVLSIMQAQQTMWIETEREKNERLKAFSEERISLDQVEHDAALALMQSQQDAYIRFQEEKKRMAFQTASALIGIIETLGQKNKIAAQAAIALNTILSVAQAVQNIVVASTRAMAELGPIAGPPAVAAIKAWGAVQIGAIIAAGALKFAGMGKGGTGAPTPVSVGPSATQIGMGAGQAQGGLRIIIYGDFYGDEAFIDRLAEKINYAVENRNVRVVSSEVV